MRSLTKLISINIERLNVVSLIFKKTVTVPCNSERSYQSCSVCYKQNVDADADTNRRQNLRSVAEASDYWTQELLKNHISEPEDSIRNIVAHIFKIRKLSDLDVIKNKLLNNDEEKVLKNLCHKRLQRMPVQYIIGEWDFRDLNLIMRPPVFIPRPETEQLVDLVLEEIRSRNSTKILELCSGSGAISVALLKECKNLEVTAVDQSEEACQLTIENAQRLGLDNRLTIHHSKLSETDHLAFIETPCDIIVSNPPYVPSEDMNELQQEIRLYEDLQALDGGYDGLDIIKIILNVACRLLRNHGRLFLEVDPCHPAKLKHLLSGSRYPKLAYLNIHKDFCDKERFVEIIKRS